jgi:hypothetical protein
MYVCTYVRTYVSTYVCIYVYVYVLCMYICIYTCMYICVYVYLYECLYVSNRLHVIAYKKSELLNDCWFVTFLVQYADRSVNSVCMKRLIQSTKVSFYYKNNFQFLLFATCFNLGDHHQAKTVQRINVGSIWTFVVMR